MRRLLRILLLRPILWASGKFASKPKKERIFEALSMLLKNIRNGESRKGLVLDLKKDERFIIFSDQHRGAKNGSDDFMYAEPNYLKALEYYFEEGFRFISLGDSEELWENSLAAVKKHNEITFNVEKMFIRENRFYKVFGNHDLFWDNDPLASWQLKKIYGQEVHIYEGLILKLDLENSDFSIFLTHGHQGDAASDGNWFSKFFVARIWAPLQAYLRINPNTPAYNDQLKTEHNRLMYEWSDKQDDLILITGHTHQPVFASLTHLENLYKNLLLAENENNSSMTEQIQKEIKRREKEYQSIAAGFLHLKPNYFNTGCCCFSDGDITGIELTAEEIRLVKWNKSKGRQILEHESFTEIIRSFKKRPS